MILDPNAVTSPRTRWVMDQNTYHRNRKRKRTEKERYLIKFYQIDFKKYYKFSIFIKINGISLKENSKFFKSSGLIFLEIFAKIPEDFS